MANIQLKGPDAVAAATELVKGLGFVAFNLEPDRVQTARIIAPIIDTPENLGRMIQKAVDNGWVEHTNFIIREDVPPPESAGGVVGTPILA